MCVYVYLSAQQPLPCVRWNPDAPAFHVAPVEREAPVRSHLPFPNVYVVGSHEGCGCAFDQVPYEKPDEREAQLKAQHDLLEYLHSVAGEVPIHLLMRWFGDESSPSEPHAPMSPDEFMRSATGADDRPQLFRIVAAR